MANEMGSKNLDATPDESEESSYRLICYHGSILPEEYLPFVLANFLNSLRYGNDWFKLIDKDCFFNPYTEYIKSLLKRPTTFVTMARLKDNTALGFCIYEGETVHYVFVKNEVRRQGICQAILPNQFNTISHVTNKGLKLWVNHYQEVKFNPFA